VVGSPPQKAAVKGESLMAARVRLAGAIGAASRKLWRRTDLASSDTVVLDLLIEALVRVGDSIRPHGAGAVALEKAPDHVRRLIDRLVPVARPEGVTTAQQVHGLDRVPTSPARGVEARAEVADGSCIDAAARLGLLAQAGDQEPRRGEGQYREPVRGDDHPAMPTGLRASAPPFVPATVVLAPPLLSPLDLGGHPQGQSQPEPQHDGVGNTEAPVFVPAGADVTLVVEDGHSEGSPQSYGKWNLEAPVFAPAGVAVASEDADQGSNWRGEGHQGHVGQRRARVTRRTKLRVARQAHEIQARRSCWRALHESKMWSRVERDANGLQWYQGAPLVD